MISATKKMLNYSLTSTGMELMSTWNLTTCDLFILTEVILEGEVRTGHPFGSKYC